VWEEISKAESEEDQRCCFWERCGPYMGSRVNSSIQRLGKREQATRKISGGRSCKEDWTEVM
jgi:hypothetical protein